MTAGSSEAAAERSTRRAMIGRPAIGSDHTGDAAATGLLADAAASEPATLVAAPRDDAVERETEAELSAATLPPTGRVDDDAPPPARAATRSASGNDRSITAAGTDCPDAVVTIAGASGCVARDVVAIGVVTLVAEGKERRATVVVDARGATVAPMVPLRTAFEPAPCARDATAGDAASAATRRASERVGCASRTALATRRCTEAERLDAIAPAVVIVRAICPTSGEPTAALRRATRSARCGPDCCGTESSTRRATTRDAS